MNHILFAAFVLALCIGTAVYLEWPRKPKAKTREPLRRELEEAEKNHAKRSHIRKLFVKATAEQIKRELRT